MKNDTNIYDIDGNIIRKAGDNHKFTIDEVEKLVDDLTEKVRQNPENQVYKVYLNNAEKWLFHMYNTMSPEDVRARLTSLESIMKQAVDNSKELEQKNLEEINEEIDKFKAQYEGNKENIRPLHSGESETNEEGSAE